MNYLKLKGEIVLLDNILHAEIKENTIEILYGINVPEQGNKFYGPVLDYSEVKNDVNEEKTKIEQDYEKLMKNLNIGNSIDNLKEKINKNRNKFYYINVIINDPFLSRKEKIKQIEEMIKDEF